MLPNSEILVVKSTENFYDIVAAGLRFLQSLDAFLESAPFLAKHPNIPKSNVKLLDARLFLRRIKMAKHCITLCRSPLHGKIECRHSVGASENGRFPFAHRSVPSRLVTAPSYFRVHLCRRGAASAQAFSADFAWFLPSSHLLSPFHVRPYSSTPQP